MRNAELEKLETLVGEWRLTLSDAWFMPGEEGHGSAVIEWLGDAFLVLRSELDGNPTWDMVIGRSDAQDAYSVLYHDDRGVCRTFAMTFADGSWTLDRKDPDMHQRFIAEVERNRIAGRWEASDDAGQTWRKDFDLTFERR